MAAPMNFETVRAVALALPGVEEGTCYGTPAFRVRGKFLLRLREDGEWTMAEGGGKAAWAGMELSLGCAEIPLPSMNFALSLSELSLESMGSGPGARRTSYCCLAPPPARRLGDRTTSSETPSEGRMLGKCTPLRRIGDDDSPSIHRLRSTRAG